MEDRIFDRSSSTRRVVVITSTHAPFLLDLGLHRFAGAIVANGEVHGYRIREAF
jgi:hypothetical protein